MIALFECWEKLLRFSLFPVLIDPKIKTNEISIRERAHNSVILF